MVSAYMYPHSDQPHRELSHRDLRNYSRFFRSEWPVWVVESPQHWKDDLFITNNSPISLMIRYGQDQLIADPTTLAVDAASFDLERDTRFCRTMWVALATRLRFALFYCPNYCISI